MHSNWTKTLMLSLIALGLATSCVVRGRPGVSVYADIPLITLDPPAPYYEVAPAPPYPDYVWIPGSWRWEGGRYNWHRGYWERPRPGYRWIPYTWHRDHKGWKSHGGHWEREGRRNRW